jgi:hypothetical protein
MTGCALTERRAESGEGFDYLDGGFLVGRLVWLARASATHDVAGWWLVDVAGKPDEPLYRVPKRLSSDLDVARKDGESASRWFARMLLSDNHRALLARASD